MKVPGEHFTEKVTCDQVVIQPAERGGRTQSICRNRYLVKQGCLGSGRYASKAVGFAEGREGAGERRWEGTDIYLRRQACV